jgi:uncharacterized phiE125 gp8 family phage protein
MYKLITPPQSEPLSLEEAKAHLRVTGTEEDNLINSLITAVRNEEESYLNRCLISQVWDLYLDGFPSDGIVISKTQVISVTIFKYYDCANFLQTLSSS